MSARDRGALIAKTLAGAWRSSPSPLDLSPDALLSVSPLLLASGSASLAWARARVSPIKDSPAGWALHQAYRLATLQAAVSRHSLAEAIQLLRERGIEATLAKGWAIARLYAEEGLRPYTDLDVAIAPAALPAVQQLLVERKTRANLDLHTHFAPLDDRPWDEIQARTFLLPVEGVPVRVLGPEDHLRLLSLHMLGHGAWRPLWLCDLGAALETGRDDLDWDYLRRGDRRRSEWLTCTLLLAERLLGADLSRVPAVVRDRRLPRWLLPAVLEQWGRGVRKPQGARLPMAWQLRLAPARLGTALWERWPNPIEASLGVGAPANDLPRWPFQVGECLARTLRFVFQRPRTGSATSRA